MSIARNIIALVAVGLLAYPASPARAAAPACAGDCDGNGSVSVDNLVLVVNVILGTQPISACPAGDANHDGHVSVSDAVSAVQSALDGCASPQPTDVASTAVALARALAQVPRLAGVIATSLGSLGEPGDCELGGSYSSTCEDSGSGTQLNQVTVNHCRGETPEGPVELNGGVNVIASGQCSLLVAAGARFVVDGQSTVFAADNSPLVTADLDMTLTLNRLIFGTTPCGIKGGQAAVQGDAVHHTLGGHALSLHFDATDDTTEFTNFVGMCDPAQLRSTLNGPMTINDDYGSASFVVPVALDGMVIALDVPNRQMRLAGSVATDCLGGSARLETVEPLDYSPGRPCFSSGVLAVGLPTGTTQVTMRAGGGVDVDSDGDGSVDASYSSCLDLLRAACE